ncbi:MAG TPA: TRAP transporter small permease [Pseudolabrys sp.]|nr:TRAP transporter small permease [Pseudolabrys sp.]
MTVISSLLDRLERVAIAAAILSVLLMGLLMNVEVFGRTLFGRSTQISDEFAGYFFTAATLLCLVPAMRHGRFLRVEAVINRVPPAIQTVLKVIGGIIGAGMSAVLTWTTFELAWTSWSYGTVSLQAVQVPLVIPQAILPIGFGLLTLAFVEQTALALLHRESAQETEILHGLD